MSTSDRHGGHGPHPVELVAPADWAPASSTPDRCDGFELISDVMVLMRDGVRLGTDVYLPRGLTPAPAVMIRLPYGKTEDYAGMGVTAAWFARKGYACVVQDVRGKFSSEGEFEPLVNEIDDTYDAIDWLAKQEWSDGRVGMWGESYYGWTSYCGAVGGHPALRAIAPGDIALDRYSHSYRGGAFAFNTVGNWAISMTEQGWVDASVVDPWHLPLIEIAESAGLDVPYLRELLEHPLRDEFWKYRSMREIALDKVRVPTLVWGGWYDVFSGPSVDEWQMINARNLPARHTHLLMGPWDHYGSGDSTDKVGIVYVGETALKRWDTYQAFFDRYLMEIENGYGADGQIEIFTIGDNRWRTLHEWPPCYAIDTRLYLHSAGAAATRAGDGTLSAAVPGDEPADVYDYDPQDPVADTLAMNCWAICNDMGDRGEVEDRPDVLVYTTAVLEEALEITGRISATLNAASSAVDTDFVVSLCEVLADDRVNLIADGIVRARRRDIDAEPSLIEPGRIYTYAIDMFATSYVVPAGHRVRLEVTSSCFNRYDRNPNTGDDFAHARETVVARQKIHHSAERPSYVTLPIISRTAISPQLV